MAIRSATTRSPQIQLTSGRDWGPADGRGACWRGWGPTDGHGACWSLRSLRALLGGPQTSARNGGRWSVVPCLLFAKNGYCPSLELFVFGFLTYFPFFPPLLIWFLLLIVFSSCLLLSSCLFASVLLRWLRCCSSVWQPSYFWGIPWVWRGASIRFSPSLYKPSGLDGRQSVRRGYCGRQRRRIRVSPRGGDLGPALLVWKEALVISLLLPMSQRPLYQNQQEVTPGSLSSLAEARFFQARPSSARVDSSCVLSPDTLADPCFLGGTK